MRRPATASGIAAGGRGMPRPPTKHQTGAKGPYKKPGAVFRPGFSHSFLRLPTCSRVLLQSLLTASCTPSDIEDCLDWRIFLCLYRVPSFELQRLVNYRGLPIFYQSLFPIYETRFSQNRGDLIVKDLKPESAEITISYWPRAQFLPFHSRAER